MPVAQASLDNLKLLTQEDQVNGGTNSGLARFNSTLELALMQKVLFRIVTEPMQYMEDDKVLPIPAREIAQAARAYQVLEAQRRANLGKANPAPIKSEGKSKSRSRSGLVPPAPRVAEPEPSQVAVAPITPAVEPPPSA